ncbi:hypothetical protein GCM10028818_06870 [Spirosoma horti]
MKKVVILMLGLVASTASFATTNEPDKSTAAQTHLVMTPEHKIKFYVQPIPAKGQLMIRDANGQSVYTETVNLQKGLSQQFDLSSLGTGTYQLALVAGTQTLTKTFVIQVNPNESFVVQE